MNRYKFTLILVTSVFLLMLSCNSEQKKTSDSAKAIDTAAALQKGDTISAIVQKILLANVMTAITSGGPGYAVAYCNVHAIPLTDSLAKANNCLIQRVSDKYRNPANKPTKTDIDILEKLSSSLRMNPMVVKENGLVVYYKPIKIAMPACLKCHGNTEKDIALKTLEIIREKYPDDLATGYKEGDLRGVWKITFLAD